MLKLLSQQVLFLCVGRASFIHCEMSPLLVLLVYITSRVSVENWFMRKLKDGEEKLPKSASHTTVVVLLGDQLLFVIIFEECTVLLGRVSGGTGGYRGS